MPKLTSEERIARLVVRHLNASERGKRAFDLSNKYLAKARAAGLQPGAVIAIDTEVEVIEQTGPDAGLVRIDRQTNYFRLVSHVAKLEQDGAVYRPARLPAYSIEPLSKKEAAALRKAEQ